MRRKQTAGAIVFRETSDATMKVGIFLIVTMILFKRVMFSYGDKDNTDIIDKIWKGIDSITVFNIQFESQLKIWEYLVVKN
ncbi:hypothetical protein GWI33_021043 [Rhynchophorus ferrugineus]|uniref:Uncharacterized protein n=1 Tax=Rhynchophorus ferrugineus TaxID=354439 RepID=A0A834HNI1_RHYFE|nr:hypothetical protein GWI33_021043 [Rhynchophorus ferrugineus]